MDLGGPESSTHRRLGTEGDVQTEPVDLSLHLVERNAGVDQGAEQHVATHSCGSVDPTDCHEADTPKSESI